jgi:hypothetical protein
MDLTQLSVFERIEFLEESHSYLIDGIPTNSPSVTQLIKKFKKEFDAEKAATRVARRRGITPEQILAEWKLNNSYSTTIGSLLHKFIENFYHNERTELSALLPSLEKSQKQKIIENLPALVSHFKNFYEDHKHLKCIKSELIVGDLEDTKICGTSDLLVHNQKTGELEILDFKTNKKMSKNNSYGKLLYPFDDMYEGQINEYTIQLNVYQYFIEKYTDFKIANLKIIWFHADNENYQIFDLENIQHKIDLMFDSVKSKSLFSIK